MTIRFTTGWGRRAATLLLVAGGLTAAVAEPAAAARLPLVGLVSVSDTTVHNNDSVKYISITCPDNKTVVGTGWSTNPSTAELRLQRLVPSRRTVLTVVHEDHNWFDSPWSLTVYAWCAETPPGWLLSSAKTATNSDSYHTAIADCPVGQAPLGVGVDLGTGQGQVVVTDIDPGYTGVRVSAYEQEGGTNATWWIQAYVICADPPAGWELLSSDNQTAYPGTTQYTLCSAGKTAISAGIDLNGAYGQVGLTSLRGTAYQNDAFGIAVAREDETGAPDTWTVTGKVICVS